MTAIAISLFDPNMDRCMAAACHDLAELGQTEDLSREDWLALMLDREAATRADKRLANRLCAAKLRFSEACIEDIDFATERGLDRRNIPALAAGAWLKTALLTKTVIGPWALAASVMAF